MKESEIGNKVQIPEATERVAYIRIIVDNMEKALEFYTALGLVAVNDDTRNDSDSSPLVCLLQSPARRFLGQPYILLEEKQVGEHNNNNNTTPLPQLHAAEHVGIARMCLVVKNVKETVAKLAAESGFLHPMAEPVDGNLPGESNMDVTVAAFRDPTSNNIVELLSFSNPSILIKLASRFIYMYPLILHVSINVTNYKTSLNAYKTGLGFEISKDFGRFNGGGQHDDEIDGGSRLHRAIAIPDPGIASHVSLLKLSKDKIFVVEMMQWENPQTTYTHFDASANWNCPNVCIGILVRSSDDDMATAMKIDDLTTTTSASSSDPITSPTKVEKNSTTLVRWQQYHCDNSQRQQLPPPLGLMTVVTALDPNGMPIEIVAYCKQQT